MIGPKTLVDTDILSAIMKRQAVALNHARNYLTTYSQLTRLRSRDQQGLRAGWATSLHGPRAAIQSRWRKLTSWPDQGDDSDAN